MEIIAFNKERKLEGFHNLKEFRIALKNECLRDFIDICEDKALCKI